MTESAPIIGFPIYKKSEKPAHINQNSHLSLDPEMAANSAFAYSHNSNSQFSNLSNCSSQPRKGLGKLLATHQDIQPNSKSALTDPEDSSLNAISMNSLRDQDQQEKKSNKRSRKNDNPQKKLQHNKVVYAP